jgi:hypothetical protein
MNESRLAATYSSGHLLSANKAKSAAVNLYAARITLERALSIAPEKSSTYTLLAKVCVAQGGTADCARAKAVLDQAQVKFPEDFNVRSTIDKIQCQPEPPPKPPNYRLRVILSGVIGIIGSLIVVIMIGNNVIPEHSIFALAIFAFPLGILLLYTGFKMG